MGVRGGVMAATSCHCLRLLKCCRVEMCLFDRVGTKFVLSRSKGLRSRVCSDNTIAHYSIEVLEIENYKVSVEYECFIWDRG